LKFHALLLAGGQAARMGRVKPLLPLPLLPGGGRCSALEALARLYRSVGIKEPLVVSGFHAEAVEAAARALSLGIVRNDHPEDGMFSSVRAGLAATPDCDGIFIHPADIPLVSGHTLRALLTAASGGLDAVLIPRHKGREGHPPLLPAIFKDALLRHTGEGGLRAALAALPRKEVDTPDPYCLEDMDNAEDYARLETLARRRAGELFP